MDGRPGPRIARRRLLALGAAGVAGALAGCSFVREEPRTSEGTPTPGPSEPPRTGGPPTGDGRYADRFETVVDVVADAGADPEGGDSIVPLLEEHAADDTLLYFPEGRYLMDRPWILPSFTNVGIVGDGATIVPPEGYTRYLVVAGAEEAAASEFLFDGVTFDCRAPRTAPRPIQVTVADGLEVRDVSVVGTTGTSRFDVTDEDGEGVVERLRLPDGGARFGDLNPPGCFVGPITRGHLTFADCEVAGFPNNGLYASAAEGRVDVVGGSYRNNGIAGVRVSDPGSVRGVHVRCDAAPIGFRNMRGIRLRHGRSVLVSDCTVEMLDLTYSDGAIVLGSQMETATIRDTRIRTSAPRVPAIKAKSPDGSIPSDRAPSIDCRNVEIRGSSNGYKTVFVVDRNACRFEGLTIHQTGHDRDGIHLIRSRDAVLRDARIDVTGDPFVLENSQLRRVNVTVGPDVM